MVLCFLFAAAVDITLISTYFPDLFGGIGKYVLGLIAIALERMGFVNLEKDDSETIGLYVLIVLLIILHFSVLLAVCLAQKKEKRGIIYNLMYWLLFINGLPLSLAYIRIVKRRLEANKNSPQKTNTQIPNNVPVEAIVQTVPQLKRAVMQGTLIIQCLSEAANSINEYMDIELDMETGLKFFLLPDILDAAEVGMSRLEDKNVLTYNFQKKLYDHYLVVLSGYSSALGDGVLMTRFMKDVKMINEIKAESVQELEEHISKETFSIICMYELKNIIMKEMKMEEDTRTKQLIHFLAPSDHTVGSLSIDTKNKLYENYDVYSLDYFSELGLNISDGIIITKQYKLIKQSNINILNKEETVKE